MGDGACALNRRVDVAVIAGMGGETIASIIQNAQGHLDGARLLLQPNVAAPQLRAALNRCGWRISREALARDGRRIYPIIEAVEGSQVLNEVELEVGPVLLRERPPLLARLRAVSRSRGGKGAERRAARRRCCKHIGARTHA